MVADTGTSRQAGTLKIGPSDLASILGSDRPPLTRPSAFRQSTNRFPPGPPTPVQRQALYDSTKTTSISCSFPRHIENLSRSYPGSTNPPTVPLSTPSWSPRSSCLLLCAANQGRIAFNLVSLDACRDPARPPRSPRHVPPCPAWHPHLFSTHLVVVGERAGPMASKPTS